MQWTKTELMLASRFLVPLFGAGTALGLTMSGSPSLRTRARRLARRWLAQASVFFRLSLLQLKLLHLGSEQPDGCAGASHPAHEPNRRTNCRVWMFACSLPSPPAARPRPHLVSTGFFSSVRNWLRVQSELRGVLHLESQHQLARRGFPPPPMSSNLPKSPRRRLGLLSAMMQPHTESPMCATMEPTVRDLVLVGGGHSHVAVMKLFGMAPMAGVQVTLVTRDVETPYSGMLPGYCAGLYTKAECHIDLVKLAQFAGARLVHAEAIGLDARSRRLFLSGGRPPLTYDVLSLDIGSSPKPIAGGFRKGRRDLGRRPREIAEGIAEGDL